MQTSPVSSETNTDAMSDSGLSHRVPKCARCRCHGINCELKGHKEKCQFKDCRCRSCLLVVERQKITATRVAHLRHQRKIDKQRNNGYYSNYAPLTDEEEFVLSRYVDQPDDQRAKRRAYSFDYEFENGRPYKTPAVRLPGYSDHVAHRQYGSYYYPRSWDMQARSKMSPCTRECCMPWKDRGYPEQQHAKRFYTEIPRSKVPHGMANDRRMEDQLLATNRSYVSSFEAQKFDKFTYGESHMKEELISEEKKKEQLEHEQKHIKAIETECEKEVEVEVDVEGVDPENKTVKCDKNTAISPVKGQDSHRMSAFDYTNSTYRNMNEENNQDINYRKNVDGVRVKKEDTKLASLEQERASAEQKRRRDEFIRSKCGEVLSVMFPDFDGKLVKSVAEKSGYDIQTAVEYFLEMKKKLREDETKSAFSSYKANGYSNESEPCKCCAERPRYTPYMVPGHHDGKKSWEGRNTHVVKQVSTE
eukprot:gene13283-4120_t